MIGTPTNSDDQTPQAPLDMLAPLASDEVVLADGSRMTEVYTMSGLLTILATGPPDATDVVVAMGGAMGGLLGPAGTIYHRWSSALAAQGKGVVRVGYRRPGDLETSLVDVAAATQIAVGAGARRVVFAGHSFGGAVAVQAGVAMASYCAGVATFATQSAGCECAADLPAVPFLLLHGDSDRILGPENSAMVAAIAGFGRVVTLPGTDHLLSEAVEPIDQEISTFFGQCFDGGDGENAEAPEPGFGGF